MNIYVETNFVLELALEQEQWRNCESIVQLCGSGNATLIIPAYSLAEPHETLIRQTKKRRNLQQLLDGEVRQLLRTTSYIDRLQRIQELSRIIVQSSEDEQERFIQYRQRILDIGDVVALNTDILLAAATYESTYDFAPQDALVYASVIYHLQNTLPQHACFLNRNSKDFERPEIMNDLRQFNCRMISRFDQGYDFIRSQLLP